MRTSPLQSPLARALILTLAMAALVGYVGSVSCSRTAQLSAPAAAPAQAVPQASTQPAPDQKEEIPIWLMNRHVKPSFFAPGSKAGFPLPPPQSRPEQRATH